MEELVNHYQSLVKQTENALTGCTDKNFVTEYQMGVEGSRRGELLFNAESNKHSKFLFTSVKAD